jgi:hypothetical protein
VTQVVIDAQSPSIATRPVVVPKGACEVVVGQCLSRLLDRTPSERSEDKLVFLINDQPVELFPKDARSQERVFARTLEWSAAERMGIDDESDQVP